MNWIALPFMILWVMCCLCLIKIGHFDIYWSLIIGVMFFCLYMLWRTLLEALAMVISAGEHITSAFSEIESEKSFPYKSGR